MEVALYSVGSFQTSLLSKGIKQLTIQCTWSGRSICPIECRYLHTAKTYYSTEAVCCLNYMYTYLHFLSVHGEDFVNESNIWSTDTLTTDVTLLLHGCLDTLTSIFLRNYGRGQVYIVYVHCNGLYQAYTVADSDFCCLHLRKKNHTCLTWLFIVMGC